MEGLHGVALERHGHAIAMVGDCGYGKSTLAAHALSKGARLLTDDLIVCGGANLPRVLPGAARIKLHPEIAARTLGARSGAPMNDERGKWIYPLEASEFCNEPLALARIYVLEPDKPDLHIERLTGAVALQKLLAATFDPLNRQTSRLKAHLQFHAALARSVPVFAVQMQWGLEHMDAALEALLF